jgi:hypothetical protein
LVSLLAARGVMSTLNDHDVRVRVANKNEVTDLLSLYAITEGFIRENWHLVRAAGNCGVT